MDWASPPSAADDVEAADERCFFEEDAGVENEEITLCSDDTFSLPTTHWRAVSVEYPTDGVSLEGFTKSGFPEQHDDDEVMLVHSREPAPGSLPEHDSRQADDTAVWESHHRILNTAATRHTKQHGKGASADCIEACSVAWNWFDDEGEERGTHSERQSFSMERLPSSCLPEPPPASDKVPKRIRNSRLSKDQVKVNKVRKAKVAAASSCASQLGVTLKLPFILKRVWKYFAQTLCTTDRLAAAPAQSSITDSSADPRMWHASGKSHASKRLSCSPDGTAISDVGVDLPTSGHTGTFYQGEDKRDRELRLLRERLLIAEVLLRRHERRTTGHPRNAALPRRHSEGGSTCRQSWGSDAFSPRRNGFWHWRSRKRRRDEEGVADLGLVDLCSTFRGGKTLFVSSGFFCPKVNRMPRKRHRFSETGSWITDETQQASSDVSELQLSVGGVAVPQDSAVDGVARTGGMEWCMLQLSSFAIVRAVEVKCAPSTGKRQIEAEGCLCREFADEMKRWREEKRYERQRQRRRKTENVVAGERLSIADIEGVMASGEEEPPAMRHFAQQDDVEMELGEEEVEAMVQRCRVGEWRRLIKGQIEEQTAIWPISTRLAAGEVQRRCLEGLWEASLSPHRKSTAPGIKPSFPRCAQQPPGLLAADMEDQAREWSRRKCRGRGGAQWYKERSRDGVVSHVKILVEGGSVQSVKVYGEVVAAEEMEVVVRRGGAETLDLAGEDVGGLLISWPGRTDLTVEGSIKKPFSVSSGVGQSRTTTSEEEDSFQHAGRKPGYEKRDETGRYVIKLAHGGTVEEVVLHYEEHYDSVANIHLVKLEGTDNPGVWLKSVELQTRLLNDAALWKNLSISEVLRAEESGTGVMRYEVEAGIEERFTHVRLWVTGNPRKTEVRGRPLPLTW